MRTVALVLVLLSVAVVASAAEVESRRLTHYLPQDFLETAVRTEGWTPVTLDLKGGLQKGDTVRIWAGGSIDRGGGDSPGENITGPAGSGPAADPHQLVLSPEPGDAFAVLFKTETSGVKRCLPPGKALEIKLTKDGEKVWLGFNDERGGYKDNHLGRGRRHELDPLWIRIEVVRTIVD